jgi:hypothetical protein
MYSTGWDSEEDVRSRVHPLPLPLTLNHIEDGERMLTCSLHRQHPRPRRIRSCGGCVCSPSATPGEQRYRTCRPGQEEEDCLSSLFGKLLL